MFTNTPKGVNLPLHLKQTGVGRGNPFSKGNKLAAIISGFFMPIHFMAFNIMLSVTHYGGLFGQSLRLVVPLRDISTPIQPAAHDVEIMSGLPILSKGIV